MKTDAKEITDLLAKAENFCASIPEGDNRCVLVPTIRSLCGLIPGELHFAATLANIPERDRMVAESSRRLDGILGKVQELLYQAQALGLAQEVGKLLAGKIKGGKTTGEAMKRSAETTKARVLEGAAKLRAQDVKERNIASAVAKLVKVSVRTARNYLKPT